MAWFMLGRRLVSGGSEAGIAASATAATSCEKALARGGEIVEFLASLGVVHYGPHRRQDIDRMAFVTGAITALAMAASLGFVLGIEAEVQQCVLVGAGDQENISAAAAIAAAGTAARDKLLAAKGHAAITTVACFYEDPDFVDKHGMNKLML